MYVLKLYPEQSQHEGLSILSSYHQPVFTVPASNLLTIGQLKTYTYIRNWKKYHNTGGETAEGTIRYSEDLLLSLVLSFIAPFQTQCMDGDREGIIGPGAKETKTEEENNQIILPTTLSSYMTLAKPVTTQNKPAFTKRWQAAMASQNVADIVPSTAWNHIVALATVFQNIVSSRSDLRVEI